MRRDAQWLGIGGSVFQPLDDGRVAADVGDVGDADIAAGDHRSGSFMVTLAEQAPT